MAKKIIIVEDDVDIQNLLSVALKNANFLPYIFSNGEDVLQQFNIVQPDLVLLDAQLPGIDGFEVCAEIRKFSNVPIIFVSCLADGSDIIRGLELGGDDYVTKPFDLFELIARIHSNIRRSPVYVNETINHKHVDSETLSIENFRFHVHSGKVNINDTVLMLPTKEFQILFFLAQHPEQIFHPSELYRLIWGEDSIGQTQAIKVHISNLRKKLESISEHHAKILNIRGFGYQLLFHQNDHV